MNATSSPIQGYAPSLATTEPVHVIGASGRTGLALCRTLLAGGVPVVAVVRSPAKWAATGLHAQARLADARQPDALRAALSDATRIVSCVHARHTASILEAAPRFARLVLLGSTRKFTQWPDDHGNGVLEGEAALLASARQGVMLHPTMIYGAQGENNVQRLAALLRRTRVLPLPGGGRFLVQPIHQSDVVRCICAALQRPWPDPDSLVIAGPEPVSYAGFVRAVAAAAGLRRPLILPFPAAPLILAARLTRHVRAIPPVEPGEIRRLVEDKAFDITPMVAKLHVRPISLQEGLALTFRPPQED
nr:NAD(P)H-binding protein [uncultured Rhodopila sp.]